jgi:hypothetical protein
MPLSEAAKAAAIIDAHYQAYGAGDVAAILATLAPGFRCGPITGGPDWIAGLEAAGDMYRANVARWPLSLTQELGALQVGGRVIRRERSAPATPGDRTVEVLGIYSVVDGLIAHLDMAVDGPGTQDSVAVAAAQLEAYNVQDLDAHVACFAPDVTVANLHEAPNLSGREAYRDRMAGVLAQFPHNRVELLGRLALGSIVCDHELVLRGPGVEPFEVIAVYHIADGLIRTVQFIR